MKDYAKFSNNRGPGPFYKILLVICLVISLAGLVYLGHDLWKTTKLDTSQIAAKLKALKEPAKKTNPSTTLAPKKELPSSPTKPKFDFYTLLPQMKMSSTVEESPVIPKPNAALKAQQEYFVLQIASLQNPNAAEDLINRLNLLGIATQTELVQKNGSSWIRIMSKPYNNFQAAQTAQERLHQHHISSLLLKIKK